MRKHQFKLDNRPAGWAVDVMDGGKKVRVQSYGMHSWEDRDTLMERLDGFSQYFLAPLDLTGAENSIRSAVAVVHPSNEAEVCLDPTWHLEVRASRAVRMGDPVLVGDLTAVLGMYAEEVVVPDDAAVAVVFSLGWRRGIYYDLRPTEELRKRPRNLKADLATLFAQLQFEQRFRISDDDWRQMFEAGWFPFAALGENHIKQMRSLLARKEPLVGMTLKIEDDLRQRLDQLVRLVSEAELLEAHRGHLFYAIERFRERDYFGAANTLFPRIEGVMRSHFRSRRSTAPKTKELIAEATDDRMKEPEELQPLLMPSRFRSYLETVVFRGYEGGNTDVVSRHSIAHGEVAAERLHDPTVAVRALLTLEHLIIMMQDPSKLRVSSVEDGAE